MIFFLAGMMSIGSHRFTTAWFSPLANVTDGADPESGMAKVGAFYIYQRANAWADLDAEGNFVQVIGPLMTVSRYVLATFGSYYLLFN